MSILIKSDLNTILLHIGTQVQDLWGHWQKSDNYLNIILWSSFNYLTCSGFLVLSSGWERALPTERWVVVVFVTFLSHFRNYWRPLLAFDDLPKAFLETQMWQKCNMRKFFCQFFDTFLNRLLPHFKYFFVFCQFFVRFWTIFVRFLSHICFLKNNYPITIWLRSFVRFLSVFC